MLVALTFKVEQASSIRTFTLSSLIREATLTSAACDDVLSILAASKKSALNVSTSPCKGGTTLPSLQFAFLS